MFWRDSPDEGLPNYDIAEYQATLAFTVLRRLTTTFGRDQEFLKLAPDAKNVLPPKFGKKEGRFLDGGQP
jgi:hypothetical protein